MANRKSNRGRRPARARAAAARREEPSDPRKKDGCWRWVVDDRMRNYGDIDYERRVIRVNRAMHKRDGEHLIDTLFHEELHRLFPRLGEWAVCVMTKGLLPMLSRTYKAQLYARIRDR